MGDKTGISWTTHTHNVWWGCDDADAEPGSDDRSPECTNCYARAFDHRIGGEHWGALAPRRFFGDAYWRKPLAWNAAAQTVGVRARVFCSSMADVFELHRDPAVRSRMDAERQRLWRLIQDTPWLDWQLLTKRPENFAAMLPWTGEPWLNVWLGVTAGVRRSLWRVAILRATPAVVRFVSGEPLLEHIQGADWDRALARDRWLGAERVAVNWLIIGDESGHGRRPAQLDWVRTAREAALRHGVAFHFKQWNDGKKVHLPVLDGRRHAAFPEVAR